MILGLGILAGLVVVAAYAVVVFQLRTLIVLAKASQKEEGRIMSLADDALAALQTLTGAVDTLIGDITPPDALMKTLKEAYRCLKSGGTLVAMGPNIAMCHGNYWLKIDHYLPLSHRSLCEALELAGFTITECHARFLPLTMHNEVRQYPMWTVRTYLKYPILWKLFGKQFLIVATK